MKFGEYMKDKCSFNSAKSFSICMHEYQDKRETMFNFLSTSTLPVEIICVRCNNVCVIDVCGVCVCLS